MPIIIPRWAQLVLLPVVLLAVLFVLGEVSHALFVFLMATLLALVLNPIVESLRKVFVPRAIGVPLVYLTFVALLVVLGLLGVPPLIEQGQRLVERVPEFAGVVEDWFVGLQRYLESRGLQVDLQGTLDRTVVWLESRSLSSAGTIFNYTVNVFGSLASFFLVVIISFYMLIDGRRIHRYLARVAPGDERTAESYLQGLQTSFTRYVKGQLLLATSVGLAAGIGVWALGWDIVGIWPEGGQYALLFGFWAGITEVIPYIGPFLGATPPVLLALFNSPTTALWVAAIFFAVQQLENHILVPNIIGSSVGVHPLVVIFALLAGAQIGGILGMLAVLPLLAMLRHTLEFYDFRLSRAAWIADDGIALPEAPRRPLPPRGGAATGVAAPLPRTEAGQPQPATGRGLADGDEASDPGPDPGRERAGSVASGRQSC